ncbi:MAG: hypothetical protein ACTSO9_03310 [Candidatus Helarchaeota archaeon]
MWDIKLGPKLKNFYPNIETDNFFLAEIGNQLFHAAVCIYGQQYFNKPQGIFLRLENIKMSGYIYFDIKPDESEFHRFMLALISPKLNYLETIKIKEIFSEIAPYVKENKEWNVKKYWDKILNILMSSQSYTEDEINRLLG